MHETTITFDKYLVIQSFAVWWLSRACNGLPSDNSSAHHNRSSADLRLLKAIERMFGI